MKSFLSSLLLVVFSAPAFAQYLNVGDTIWTRNGLEGQVVGFFANGQVSVKIGYSNYNYTRDQLASRGCVANFCSGDAVVTRNGLSGTINGAFPDNLTLSVKIGYSNYAYTYDQLAGGGGVGPYPGSDLQVNDTVWTTNGLQGTVVAFFANGQLSVKIGYTNYTYSRDQLAAYGCTGSFCSGDHVVTTNGLTGTINGIFPDGYLSVKIGYSNYRYSPYDLARTN